MSTPALRSPARPKPVRTSARAALAAALAVPLLACGGEDAEPAAPPLRAEVVAALATLWGTVSPDSRETGRCVGRALVRRHEPGELQAAGLLDDDWAAPAELPPVDGDVARSWVDAWFGCVDPIAVAARAQRATMPGLDVRSFKQCVRATVDKKQLRRAALDDVAGREASPAVIRLSTALFECGQEHQ